MFTGLNIALFLGVAGLLPSFSYQNPYPYYGPYSRSRRDPAASWQTGYGQAMPQMNPMAAGQDAGYGARGMDNQLGTGMGPSYGMNRYHSMNVENPLQPIRGGMDSQRFREGSRQDGGASDITPQNGQRVNPPPPTRVQSGPSGCDGVTCDDLSNCIKVAMNESSCCPKCTKYGCVCEGYQLYDCKKNGFSDGMLPEGKSYKVADGTTVCSCPPGGGSILCSFRDPTSSSCPELTPNCIQPFVREIDGCSECAKVGCVGDDGVKVEAGLTINKPPCSICYCPPAGGSLMCGVDPNCDQTSQRGTEGGNLALQSKIREIDSFGQSREGSMYGYSPYGAGYPDYGSQFGMPSDDESPVVPPLSPVRSDQTSQSGTESNPPKSGESSQLIPNGGYGQYPQQGYGFPYQNPYQYMDYGGQYNNYLRSYGAGFGYPDASSNMGDAQQVNGGSSQKAVGATKPGDDAAPMAPKQGGQRDIYDGTQGYDSSSVAVPGSDQQQQGQAYGNQDKVPGGNGFQSGQGFAGYPMPGQYGGQYGAYPPSGNSQQYYNQRGQQSGRDDTQSGRNLQSADSTGNAFGRDRGGSQYGGVDQGQYRQSGAYPPLQPNYQFQQPSVGQGSRSSDSSQMIPRGSDDVQSPTSNEGNMQNPYAQIGRKPDSGSNPMNVPNPAAQFGEPGRRIPPKGLGQNDGEITPPLMTPGSDGINMQPRFIPPRENDGSQSRKTRNHHGFILRGRMNQEPVAVTTTTTAAATTTTTTPRPTTTPTTTTTTTTTKPTTTTTTTTRPTTTTTTTKPTTTTTTTTPPPTTTTTTTTTTTKPTTVTTTTKPTTTTTTTRQTTTKPTTTEPISKSRVAERRIQEDERLLIDCCSHGKIWAGTHDSCSGIIPRRVQHQELCFFAQKQCCEEAKSESQCQDGINAARTTGSCARSGSQALCGNDPFTTCCGCCQMGLRAREEGMSCETSVFGQSCGKAYQSCCQQGGAESRSHTDAAVTDTTSSTTTTTVATTTNQQPRCATHGTCQQICVDTIKGMLCSCRRGYKLHKDGISCEDINECVIGTHTCTENQLCLNRQGSYFCQRRLSCGTGYELTSINTCEDIDECALGVHDCLASATCENQVGSYVCIPKECDAGYITDATGRCIDINECRIRTFTCPFGASCVNTEGSYECECPAGLRPNVEDTICEDIDECRLGISTCSKRGICVNTIGSFICREPPKLTCGRGYMADESTNSCVDVDECTAGTHSCNEGSTCINEVGGYRCQDPLLCPDGMKPSENERVCVDINECEDTSLHRCDVGGVCLNLMGSFKCRCSDGYESSVTRDGLPTCEDIDECTMRVGRKCNYRCRNLPGSYECVCPEGYKVGSSPNTCEDIDECASSPCSGSETCFNTQGSYKCKDLSCPTGYKRYSNTRCSRLLCRGKPRSCLKLPKQISHHNISVANGTVPDKPLFRMSVARTTSNSRYNFALTSGNEDGLFKVRTSSSYKRPSGIVYTAKELVGPKEYVIDLTLYLLRGRRKTSYISRLYVFVAEYDL